MSAFESWAICHFFLYTFRMQLLMRWKAPNSTKGSAASIFRLILRALLNICCPYTSRYEISNAIQQSALKYPDASCITPSAFETCLLTHSAPPLDILIRTSGEIRLSDFMTWQVCKTIILSHIPHTTPHLFMESITIVLT